MEELGTGICIDGGSMLGVGSEDTSEPSDYQQQAIQRPLIEHESIDRTSIYPSTGAVSATSHCQKKHPIM